MLNLLSSEIYKFKKSMSFKVCLIIPLCMIIFNFIMINLVMGIQKGEIENGTAGIELSEEETQESVDGYYGGYLDIVSQTYSAGYGTIFNIIFICLWVVGEYANGAIKNMTGTGYSRKQIFIAKYLSANMAAFIINLICMLVIAIGAMILDGAHVDAGMIQNLVIYTFLQMGFGAAFASIVITICELTRNIAAGISIGMGIMFFSELIMQGVDLLLHTAHLNFKVSAYWVMNIITECPIMDYSEDFIGRGIAVIVMWMIIPFVLGMAHFERTDIK